MGCSVIHMRKDLLKRVLHSELHKQSGAQTGLVLYPVIVALLGQHADAALEGNC